VPVRPSPWIPGTLALALVACGGNVVVDGSPSTTVTSTTTSAGGTTTTTGAGGGGGGSSAVLLRNMPPDGLCDPDPTTHPPDAVFLYVASRPISCANPVLPDFGGCGTDPFTWEVCVSLSLAAAPTSIDLSSYPYATEEVQVCADCACKGGGIFNTGTLDVSDVTATSAQIDLIGTNEPGLALADGVYTAPRCP
jgi:hypothetical protein